jgi:hypothetical protein
MCIEILIQALPNECWLVALVILFIYGQIHAAIALYGAEIFILDHTTAIKYALDRTIMMGCNGIPLDPTQTGNHDYLLRCPF